MAKQKFYGVRQGKEGFCGVCDTWEACKAAVSGVSGAQYKSFPTREEAQRFVEGPAEAAAPQEDGCIAYTDGSYDPATGDFSCGAVLFWRGETVEIAKRYSDPELAAMRNVAGEILGATEVIRFCLEHGIPAVEIVHDYSGVGMWGQGLWKTNRPGTQAYAAFCDEARKHLSLRFRQVQGHSGDR